MCIYVYIYIYIYIYIMYYIYRVWGRPQGLASGQVDARGEALEGQIELRMPETNYINLVPIKLRNPGRYRAGPSRAGLPTIGRMPTESS